MRFLFTGLVFTSFFVTSVFANPLPVPPKVENIPALKVFAEESGAAVEFVTRQHGVDMWVATKGDVMQVIHTTPDGQGMLMNGFLFSPEGRLVTDQILEDYAAGKVLSIDEKVNTVQTKQEPKTPGDKLWSDLGNSHYIEFGSKSAPLVYTFVDPFCPHCKLFWSNISAPYVNEGRVRIRLVPVGVLGEESANVASYILRQNDRQQAWLALVAQTMDASVLQTKGDLSMIFDNFKLMQKWKMSSTPFSVYKGSDGKVKMYRGNPDDIIDLVSQIAFDK